MKINHCSILLTLALALLWRVNIQAQGITFEKTFGGEDNDRGYSVQQTFDDGFIIAGAKNENSSNPGQGDLYLIRTDASGDSLWTRTYVSVDFYNLNSVLQTNDSNFIMVGAVESPAPYMDVFLMKINWAGDSIWSRTYGGSSTDIGYSVQQTFDGGFIISGETVSSTIPQSQDVYLIKTDSNGDTLWTKNYGGTATEIGYDVKQNK